MSTIAERVAAALAAETGEAITSNDVTRSPISGCWCGQAGGATVFAERGRARIFLGDRFFVYDNMTLSTSVEAIRTAIRSARENRAVVRDMLGWLEYAGWKHVAATNDWGRWRVAARADGGETLRASVVGGYVSLLPSENSAPIREAALELLERNGVPVIR